MNAAYISRNCRSKSVKIDPRFAIGPSFLSHSNRNPNRSLRTGREGKPAMPAVAVSYARFSPQPRNMTCA
jgi:hypothetical protein